MKRMNLIRVALFAVFAFMGTLSLSAQTWLPPAQAIVKLNTELAALQNEQPTSPTPPGVASSQQQMSDMNAKSGCADCMLKAVKKSFMEMSLVRIKEGADTGVAVTEVRTVMINAANNNAQLLSTIQSGFVFMNSILN
jgi:hypothetical protein